MSLGPLRFQAVGEDEEDEEAESLDSCEGADGQAAATDTAALIPGVDSPGPEPGLAQGPSQTRARGTWGHLRIRLNGLCPLKVAPTGAGESAGWAAFAEGL